jgi:hypothetical protein
MRLLRLGERVKLAEWAAQIAAGLTSRAVLRWSIGGEFSDSPDVQRGWAVTHCAAPMP